MFQAVHLFLATNCPPRPSSPSPVCLFLTPTAGGSVLLGEGTGAVLGWRWEGTHTAEGKSATCRVDCVD